MVSATNIFGQKGLFKFAMFEIRSPIAGWEIKTIRWTARLDDLWRLL